jgi:hypothetical protein
VGINGRDMSPSRFGLLHWIADVTNRFSFTGRRSSFVLHLRIITLGARIFGNGRIMTLKITREPRTFFTVGNGLEKYKNVQINRLQLNSL